MNGQVEILSIVPKILVSPFIMVMQFKSGSGIEIYHSDCTKIHWHTTLALFAKVSAHFTIRDKKYCLLLTFKTRGPQKVIVIKPRHENAFWTIWPIFAINKPIQLLEMLILSERIFEDFKILFFYWIFTKSFMIEVPIK